MKLSGEQSVSGSRVPSFQQGRGCQDSGMTSANRMERKCHHQKRKLREMSGRKRCPDKQQACGRSVKFHECQEQAGSRDSGSIRQECREQDMSRTGTSSKLCVTKLCVTIVCDKVVRERWCDSVVCDKVVCVSKLCVTKLCVTNVCDKVVCERWCDSVVCDKVVCEQVVRDKIVCDNCMF